MTEVVQLETVEHWWCRRCGRWEVCDDTDLCIECSYMTAVTRRGRGGRGPRGGVDGDSAPVPQRRPGGERR